MQNFHLYGAVRLQVEGKDMLLCIDIGNTNIVLGVTDKEKVLYHWRLRTERDVTADESAFLRNVTVGNERKIHAALH